MNEDAGEAYILTVRNYNADLLPEEHLTGFCSITEELAQALAQLSYVREKEAYDSFIEPREQDKDRLAAIREFLRKRTKIFVVTPASEEST